MMKKFFLFVCFTLVTVFVFSQSNNFSYQAVVRDNNSHLVVNQNVGVRLSLIRDIPNGAGDYVETHTVQTNANGLLTLMVGQGSVVSGSMASVDWKNHTYYLKSEIDITGGTNYTVTGVQVVAAVPFAQYAASCDYTEKQVISISNDTIFLTGGTNSFVKLPIPNIHVPDSISSYINDAGFITKDSIPANISFFNNDAGYITSYVDSQQLSMSGDTLKLERGGSVILAPSCCALVDSLNDKVDSLNNGMDSLNNLIALLGSIVCKPQVTTNNVTAIYIDTAVCGGEATSLCGYAITARGVCWNTTGTANLADSHTSDGNGTGNFISVLTGLTPNTTYYVRAYIVSDNDTIYGNEVQFFIQGLPAITTTAASSITNNSAVSGGNITSDGGASITKRGVCWSTAHNPTVADDRTFDSLGIGAFTSNLTGLTPLTTYYVRAYAINSGGITYGNEVTFTTPDPCGGETSVLDIENNEYEIVVIGSQCWMKENLRTMTQPDGYGISDGYYEDWYQDCYYECWMEWVDEYDEYGEIIGGHDEEVCGDNCYDYYSEDWYWEYSYQYYAYPNYNDAGSTATYGLLYNWPAAMNGSSVEGTQGICPNGWHIPTQAEYDTLISYVSSAFSCGGNSSYIAKALASQNNWTTSANICAVGNNLSDNNASGFSAEPAGDNWSSGYGVSFWLSTESQWYSPRYFYLYYTNAYVTSSTSGRESYYSVRCIKD